MPALTTTGHYALEEVGGSVTNGRGWRLRGTGVSALTGPSTLLQLMSQSCNLFLISEVGQFCDPSAFGSSLTFA